MKRISICAAALAVLAAVAVAACQDQAAPPTASAPADRPVAVLQSGSLQYFGYVGQNGGEPALIGTESYANFGMAITGANPASDSVAQRVNALSQHGMKGVIELGLLLWCGDYRQLCPDWKDRWDTWRAANASVLVPEKTLAFIVRDEPFTNGVNIVQYDSAAVRVKADYPWAKMIFIESADFAACPHEGCDFNANAWRMSTVDWVGIVRYFTHPQTDDIYWAGLQNMKAKFPGKKIVYVADGFWSPTHAQAFGATGMNQMDDVMNEMYNLASVDTSAVMLGVFIWDSMPDAKSSRDLPPFVLQAHTAAGRAVTGLSRKTLYQPAGQFQTITGDGYAQGWACDPDAAWGETVLVELRSNGVLVGSGQADAQSSGIIPQCRSGVFRNFRIALTGTLGQTVTARAYDLNSGWVDLPASPVTYITGVSAAAGTWPGAITVTGTGRNGTGGVQLWWRDATANGAWAAVAAQPTPAAANAVWTNSFPASNPCHTYEAQARYGTASSPVRVVNAILMGRCAEQAAVTWIQPQALAGYGPPGSLVVAGSAGGGPAGQTVEMWYRDVTAGTAWTKHPYAAPTDANGIWMNSIPSANQFHQYAVYAMYDVMKSTTCTYAGQGDITWC